MPKNLEVKVTLDKALKKIHGGGKPIVKYNKNWRYPHRGDTQISCPMLQFMFDIEYRSGTLIFVPDKVNKCKMVNRNKEE